MNVSPNPTAGLAGNVPSALGNYAQQGYEAGVVNLAYPIGCFERYGAVGDGVTNDAGAIQNALNSVPPNKGGRVFGTPGKTYAMGQGVNPPNNVTMDLTDITLKPTSNADLIATGALAFSVSTQVTAGATLGSSVLTVASTAGLAAGQIILLTTDYSVTMPNSWCRIQSVNAGASQVTLETPLKFTYLGNVTLNVQPLYGKILIQGGTIDLSNANVGAPDAIVNLNTYDHGEVRGVRFVGVMTSTQCIAGIVLARCRRAIVTDCSFTDVIFQASAVSIQNAKYARTSRVDVDGDCFGTICVSCDYDKQESISYNGRRTNSGTTNSIRAVKASSGRHSIIENVHAADCETVVEYFNCARGHIKDIIGVNIGLFAYVGQTAINIAATNNDGYQQHIDVSGVNLENLGGLGIQVSGDTSGRIRIDDVSVRNCYADAILTQSGNVTIRGAHIENWNTGAVVGCAGLRATPGAGVVSVSDVVFIHTDATKSCMNLSAGPTYQVRANQNPSGNPLYDTAHGISPGAQNQFFGSVAGIRKDGAVAMVAHIGTQENVFALPNGKTFTFTVSGFAKHFVIQDASGGQGVDCFADQESATITLESNPGAIFANSSTPGAGLIGIFKTAASDVISVKNNTGASVNIGVCVMGGVVTATTDPA